MRPKLPRLPSALSAVVAAAVFAVVLSGAVPGKKKKKEPPPPTVQETVGDLSFVVSRGEMESRRGWPGRRAGQHGRRRTPVVVSQAARRRDEQGRGRACGEDGCRTRRSRW